jgi:hypothetical protein
MALSQRAAAGGADAADAMALSQPAVAHGRTMPGAA